MTKHEMRSLSQKWKVTQATSIPLVVEVVSTNWRDNYYNKLANYPRRNPEKRDKARRTEHFRLTGEW